MPEMKSARTFVLRCKTGHMISFTADEPRSVPEIAVQEALEAGCGLVEGTAKPKGDASRAKIQFNGKTRESLIFLAVAAIAKENNPKMFDSGGAPKSNVVSDRLAMEVSPKEALDVWQKYQSDRAGAEAFVTDPKAQNILRVVEAVESNELKSLGAEMGVEAEALKGLTAREMRRVILAHLNGATTA